MQRHWRYHFQGCSLQHIGIPRCLSCLHLILSKFYSFTEKLILELPLATNENPSLVQDTIGSGFPSALQDKVTLSPSVFVVPCGCAVIVGGSMKRNNRNIRHSAILISSLIDQMKCYLVMTQICCLIKFLITYYN